MTMYVSVATMGRTRRTTRFVVGFHSAAAAAAAVDVEATREREKIRFLFYSQLLDFR